MKMIMKEVYPYLPLPDGKYSIEELSKSEFSQWLNECREHSYKYRYYEACVYFDVLDSSPEWEELSEEERQRIRDENVRYDVEMQHFGESIRYV